MAPTLELAVIDARMREVHGAEDALRDLRELGDRSSLARAMGGDSKVLSWVSCPRSTFGMCRLRSSLA